MISDRQPELLPILLSHRPSIAYQTSTWLLPALAQWQINEALEKLPLSSEEWGNILAAKLITATDVAVRETVERAGDFAMHGACQWLEADVAKEFLPSQLWREALTVPAEIFLSNFGQVPPSSLAFCAWFISPQKIKRLLTCDRQDVKELSQQSLNVLPRPLRLPTAFLLVTLGLRSSNHESVKLILRGYYEVYDALANNRFPWESWLLLSNELPPLEQDWPQWDFCERLRRAVRSWLFTHYEDGKLLFSAAASKKNIEIARKTLADDSKRGELND